jgi:uncharacterized protein (DUF302 family)
MTYDRTVRLDTDFTTAVERVREALSAQGSGILTQIDVTATLKAEPDQDTEEYVVLGACNPSLAHRAVDVDRSIGLPLPRNAVVRAEGGRTVVRALDPDTGVAPTGLDALRPIADETTCRPDAALASLATRAA